MKKKETACVISQEELAADIYSLRLRVSFAEEVKAGQFLSLFSADGMRLLPRPISVCETGQCESSTGLRGREPESFPV